MAMDSIAKCVPAAKASQVVDRHDVLDVGIRRRPRYDEGSGARARRHQVVLAQSPQCLPNGVAADRKPLTQLVFGRQLRSHRVHAVHDLFPQGARDLQVAVIDNFGF